MQKAKIIVAVRKRPLFQKQKTSGYTDIITVNNGNKVIVSQMKQKVDLTKYMQQSVFNFDYAFDQNNNNQDIYSHIISPLIDSAFQGAKVSCFAYGQTGSGKTYTMNGVMSKNIPGLYTLGAYDIFQKLQQSQFSHLSAYLSFYEIYCTKLYDLLNKRTELVLRQDAKSNINVVGLSQIPITNVQQFEGYLKIGSSQRVTSQNSANSQSSRSHAILQITLKHGKKGFGKVYFIDLAGNQRGADHANQKKQTQIDGQQINKSLLQLKQCIRGLDQGKNHVPFRGSKLTMCLKDSFIGFCRTVMIGNISPSSASSQNTLNTLRYADRVKQLKNNQQLSKQQLKNRQMMLPRGNNNAIKIKINDSDDQDDIAQKKRKALEQYGIKNQQKSSINNNINNNINNTNNNINNTNNNSNSNKRQGLTVGSARNNQVGKSTSVAKNSINNNNSFFNNNLASNKQINNQKNQKKNINISAQIKKNPISARGQQNQIHSRLNKNERMQLEKNDNKSLDMRKNFLSNSHNNQIKLNHYGNNIFQNNLQTKQQGSIYTQQNNYIAQNNNSFVNNNNNNNNIHSNSLNKNINLNYNYKPIANNNSILQNNIRTNNMMNNYSQVDRQNENINLNYYNRPGSSNKNILSGIKINNNFIHQNSQTKPNNYAQQNNYIQQNKSINFNQNIMNNQYNINNNTNNNTNNNNNNYSNQYNTNNSNNNNNNNSNQFNQYNNNSQLNKINQNLKNNKFNYSSNNINYLTNNNKLNKLNNNQQQQYYNVPQIKFEQQCIKKLPQLWNQMIQFCQNSSDPTIQSQIHQKLVSSLFEQQNQLINCHSNTLQYQIQKIKQQMQIIKVIQHDRSSLSSKQYTKIMYQSIDDKISQLELLKEQLNKFMYKLDDMENIQNLLIINTNTNTNNNTNNKNKIYQDQLLID